MTSCPSLAKAASVGTKTVYGPIKRKQDQQQRLKGHVLFS